MAAVEREADTAEGQGVALRLRRLERDGGLTPLDVQLLLVAAPDLDSRFERLYGYLNDDVRRRRATTGLALELTGVPPTSAQARERLAAGGPLVDRGQLAEAEGHHPPLAGGAW